MTKHGICIDFGLADIQHQTLRRCSHSGRSLDLELFHARDNGRDKINVKDGEKVDGVKDDGNSQKAKAIESRHGW